MGAGTERVRASAGALQEGHALGLPRPLTVDDYAGAAGVGVMLYLPKPVDTRPLRPAVYWLTFRNDRKTGLEAVLHIEGWTEGKTACGWEAGRLKWIRFASIERCEAWLTEVGVALPKRCRNCRRSGDRPRSLATSGPGS